MAIARPQEVNKMTDIFLTSKEAQKILKIGHSMFYKLCKRGQIPYLRIGKLIRIPMSAIEEMAKRSVEDCEVKEA